MERSTDPRELGNAAASSAAMTYDAKVALLALVLATIAPVHVRLGPVSPSVGVAVAELFAAAESIWVAVRAIRRFRSWPWLRAAWISAGTP